MKPTSEMTLPELEKELADNLRRHPYYNGGTKWAMRRFELRQELTKRKQTVAVAK